jgi:hypothetical protein
MYGFFNVTETAAGPPSPLLLLLRWLLALAAYQLSNKDRSTSTSRGDAVSRSWSLPLDPEWGVARNRARNRDGESRGSNNAPWVV